MENGYFFREDFPIVNNIEQEEQQKNNEEQQIIVENNEIEVLEQYY